MNFLRLISVRGANYGALKVHLIGALGASEPPVRARRHDAVRYPPGRMRPGSLGYGCPA
jgi:hypothetical protein